MSFAPSRSWLGALRFIAPAVLALLGGCTAPAETATQTSPSLAQPAVVNSTPPLQNKPLYRKTALGTTNTTGAATDENPALLLGNPSNAATGPDNLLVSRPQFDLSYNRTNGGPNWVSWHVQASDLGRVGRGTFAPDPLLPADSQIRPNDYRGSGYDRGHQCPSGDRTSSRENNNATFVMSNMLPQAPALNQQVWAKLENYCRDQVRAGNELYIVAGGAGTAGRIGQGKINVPAQCWKIVVVLPEGDNDLQRITPATRVIAVAMPNQDTPEVGGARWATFLTTPSAIEQATGFKFFSNLSSATRSALEQKKDSGRGSRETNPGDVGAARATRLERLAPDPVVSLPVVNGGATTIEAPRPLPRESAPSVSPRAPSEPQAAPATFEGTQVWVNTRSGVYHYPGARWYGNTKQGQYMSESAAQAAGYRATQNGQ